MSSVGKVTISEGDLGCRASKICVSHEALAARVPKCAKRGLEVPCIDRFPRLSNLRSMLRLMPCMKSLGKGSIGQEPFSDLAAIHCATTVEFGMFSSYYH
eukprot:2598250-Amphidinium_carterae.2